MSSSNPLVRQRMVLLLRMPTITESRETMKDRIALSGLVATTPRHIVTQKGLPITTFRFVTQNGSKGNSNWYTVSSVKGLAINVATSISKGDRVIVVGTLSIQDWDNGENQGTQVEIEALTIGHDLVWGSSTFVRTTYSEKSE